MIFCSYVPHALNPLIFSEDLIQNACLSAVSIYSHNVSHSNVRDDPIFPARAGHGPRYCNNITRPGLIACIDNTEVCSPDDDACVQVTKALDNRIDPEEELRNFHVPTSQTERAYNLLLLALTGSSVAIASQNPDISLEAWSHCQNKDMCTPLPQDQWIVEARRWFEASLAWAHISILDFVQGDGSRHNVPEIHRGMCDMVKYKAAGWRNVSISGFLGLLGLAVLITLASVRNDDGALWVNIFVKALAACFYSIIRVFWQ